MFLPFRAYGDKGVFKAKHQIGGGGVAGWRQDRQVRVTGGKLQELDPPSGRLFPGNRDGSEKLIVPVVLPAPEIMRDFLEERCGVGG